jgi:hypothetical protein
VSRMAVIYTLRYTNDHGRMIRWLVAECRDDQDAVQTASARMQDHRYAALEISRGGKLVWRGTRDKVADGLRRRSPKLHTIEQPDNSPSSCPNLRERVS